MKQQLLYIAKKTVAIRHGFKDWEDIDRTLNTGWVNDAEVQEAALLDEVALYYGDLLLDHVKDKNFPKDQIEN